MTETTFDSDEWVARLGASLEALALAATYTVSFESYGSHLTYDEFRSIQAKAGRDPAIRDAVASTYTTLRSEVPEQRAILHEHPVLKEVLEDSGGGEEMYLVSPPGSMSGTNTTMFVLRLVAQTVKTSGSDAARGLHRFLADGKDLRLEAREFVVIYGLKVANRIQLGDGAFLAPMDECFISEEGFSDEDAQRLRTFGATGSAFRDGCGGSSVFVRDVTWGPGILPLSEEPHLDLADTASRFPLDVETVMDLLSVASHRPLVISTRHTRLAQWMHEVDPNLGYGSWRGGGFTYDGWWEEGDLSREAAVRFTESVDGWRGFEFPSDQERNALKLGFWCR